MGLPYTLTGPLRTERLTIRALTTADIGDLHAYESDPDVCRYLPYEPRSRDEVAEKVAQWSTALTLAADGDFWRLAVERTGRAGVVGDIYFALKSTANAAGEIGWVLHPGQTGHGYMTEAAGAILDLAFTELSLHRVTATLDPRNEPSAGLCRRLGMRREGHFVEDLWFKGEWGDTAVYAILAREWSLNRGGGAEAPPRDPASVYRPPT